MSYSCFI